MKRIYKTIKQGLSIVLIYFCTSCDDFVKIDPPRTALIRETVFGSDATSEAAVLDLYYQLRNSAFAGGGIRSLSFLLSLSSDEQTNYTTGTPQAVMEFQQFNDNTLSPNNSLILVLWSDLYKEIYKANAIMEGLTNSSAISESQKQQLTGEAKFIRAFCYFYLINLWGDVPLVLTTDYRSNSNVPRTSTETVYQQISSDLLEAQNLLADDYSLSDNERVRANKWAATALLARVYLYNKDWANAEMHAGSVISNSGLFNLVTLQSTFLVNNSEAIFQWWSELRPSERSTFRFTSTPFNGALRPEFIADFEEGDLRETTWVLHTAAGYYSSVKYNAANSRPPVEYSTTLRLAEQYLIRAEARAQQGKIASATDDINIIRNRAGLPDTSAADKASLLLAIEQERKAEFLNEWGHRWLDLKRTNRIESVLGSIKPVLTSTATLFPIPESEILNNPGLENAQNAGY